MSTVPIGGDIKVTYGDFTGASGVIQAAITDYQNKAGNMPFRYMGQGLQSAFHTQPIAGNRGSFIRYIGQNNAVKKGTGPEGVLEDWSFSAHQRESKRVSGTYNTYQIDFAVNEGEINLSQTHQAGDDIMSRLRTAQQTTLVDETFDELEKTEYVSAVSGTSGPEDKFIGTIPSSLHWDKDTESVLTTGNAKPWNIDKVNAAKFLLATNRITSNGEFVALTALDSLKGFTTNEVTRNGDYQSFVDRVFQGKQLDTNMRMAEGYNFNQLRFIGFPYLHPNDDGSGRGVPCESKSVNGNTANVYNEYIIHPRCVQYIKPADEPDMNMMTYFDKNSWQLRFRGRQLIGFMVINPTGICRVQNLAGTAGNFTNQNTN